MDVIESNTIERCSIGGFPADVGLANTDSSLTNTFKP